MKSHFQNDLNVLASGLLGFTGVIILLTPSYLRAELTDLPNWVSTILGFTSYSLALFIIGFFMAVLKPTHKIIVQLISGIILLILGGLFIKAGQIVEGFIFVIVGLGQLLIRLEPSEKIQEIDPLRFIIPAFSLFTALLLWFFPQTYSETIPSHRLVIAVTFLITALAGGIVAFFPLNRFGQTLSRLQALPWIAWCVLFFIKMSPGNMIAPGMLATTILFTKSIPWHRFTLPEHDILGRRLAMSAGTVAMAMLLFFTPLLDFIDQSIPPELKAVIRVREAVFLFFMLVTVVLLYEISTGIMTINGLMAELTKEEENNEEVMSPELSPTPWGERLSRYLKPFTLTRESIRIRLGAQADQLTTISAQLNNEKRKNKQLILLNELSQQLENHLDQPVSAQLAVNTLERALDSSLVSLYAYMPDDKSFMLIAVAGPQSFIVPPEYRQSMSQGAIGRAARQRKTQIINDVKLDSDYMFFDQEKSQSCVIAPMIFNGHVNGMIVLNDEKTNAFGSLEISLAESVAAELTRSWERSGYQKRLMSLIQSSSQLSAMVEPETTANEVAVITRDILQARFTFVHIHLGQEQSHVQTASCGDAPELLSSLKIARQTDPLIQAAFHAAKPFRVRDVRKYAGTSHLSIDHASLRSMLAIPIRWHSLSIGVILAFGKQNEVFFSENDESLAELLSIQAAGAFESTWLQQELRASLRTTSLLYRLSTHIIQAETLQDAAREIAQTAHKLARGQSTGIVLYSSKHEIEAELEVDEHGVHNGTNHPFDLVKQAMDSGQLIYVSQGKSMMRACMPIQSPIRKYGALWINIPEDTQHKASNPADLQTLVNQAAIALERSLLLVESRRQAKEIQDAYDILEVTYDQTLISLTSALDARDRETEGHSMRVSRLAAKLGEALNFTHEQLKVLERGSLLHDIGKIGISDTILHKPGPLSEEEWKIMRHHPDIGARIVQGIPFLEDAIPLIRHHQERWDGSGYPLGQKGEEIPILARMFAVVDAFDALTSKRPYRDKISTEEAVQYLRDQSGSLFDPEIVEVFAKLMLEDPCGFEMTEEAL
jgi:putative nucleotidyltransferase with HDIG domain